MKMDASGPGAAWAASSSQSNSSADRCPGGAAVGRHQQGRASQEHEGAAARVRGQIRDPDLVRVRSETRGDLDKIQVDTLRRYVEALGGKPPLEVQVGDDAFQIA